MRECEGRQYGWSVMPGGADRDCRWTRRRRAPLAIWECAARPFVSPNIILQRRAFLRKGRSQPIQKAPVVNDDIEGLLVCIASLR